MRNPRQALRNKPRLNRAVAQNNVVEPWTGAFASFWRKQKSIPKTPDCSRIKSVVTASFPQIGHEFWHLV
jgi:hypothetical protein